MEWFSNHLSNVRTEIIHADALQYQLALKIVNPNCCSGTAADSIAIQKRAGDGLLSRTITKQFGVEI